MTSPCTRSRRNWIPSGLGILLLALLVSAEAAQLEVPAQYSTIQAAIDAADPLDVIIVSPGAHGPINFGGKDLTITSTDPDDPTVVATTILDGAGSGSVVTFSGAETSVCLLTGFTITSGRAAAGGGVLGNGALATLTRNVIRLNSSFGGVSAPGAGIHNLDGLISGNWITDNESETGDGGGLADCDGTIENNVIAFNEAAGNGGGLANCEGSLINNTIYGNTAGASGGGIYGASSAVVRNNIIFANTAAAAPETAQIQGTATPNYCCIEAWSGGGVGNISDDPRLADPAGDDFRLLLFSPCIDAGGSVGLSEDITGAARPFDSGYAQRGDGSRFDIGAFENQTLPAVARELDGHLDSSATLIASDPVSGLELYGQLELTTMYLAVRDASGVIGSQDLVYLVFARQGVEARLTVPSDPNLNADYITLSGSQVVSVKPDDAGGAGGGYLRYNKLESPATELIDGATGMFGASADIIEFLANRADNQLTTTSLFAWAVVVDPAAPGVIKASVPPQSSMNDKVDALDEIQMFDLSTDITFWRRYLE